MTRKRVSVLAVISRSKSQNRATFVSSRGASTSSRTQIGAGFVRKTAKIRARAVRACSPPDSSESDCSLLPGGCARISSPASSGSSDSVSFSSAVPPPNRILNSSRKCPLTVAKLAKSCSRPCLFNLFMAARSFSMAATRSSVSASMDSIREETSSISASARKFTGPMLSRSRIRRWTRSSSTSSSGSAAASSASASLASPSGAQPSLSLICSMTTRLVSSARSRAPSARICCSRLSASAASASRCAASASARAASATASASAACWRDASAASRLSAS